MSFHLFKIIIQLIRYTAINGFVKTVEVKSNFENRRRIMMHWYSGTTKVDQGFLVRVYVTYTQ